MKKLVSGMLFMLITTLVIAQENKITDSKITGVTVFLDRAQVTRAVKTRIEAGKSTIVVSGLTSRLDQQSVQVSGKGNFTILGISHQQNYLSEFNYPAGLKVLRDSLEIVTNRVAFEQAQREILNREEQLLLMNQKIGGTNQNLTAAELKAMADFFRSRMTDLITQRMKHDERIKKLNEKLVRLQQQVNTQNELYSRNTSEIVINVSAESSVNAELLVNYIVSNAGWTPIYDLRAIDTKKPVQLHYKANVFQSTGEDWKNVRLKLSTANPSLGGVKPELYPWYLSIYNPAADRKIRAVHRGAPSVAMDEVPATMQMELLEKEEAGSVAEYVTTIQTSLNTEFDIALPYSVMSASKPTLVDIGHYTLNAEYIYSVAPKMDRDAFLMARLTGWGEYNLLPGEANVFFEGTYVTKSFIDPNSIRDTLNISLGRDKRVVVEREIMKDFTSKKVISSNLRETKAFTLSVRNTKSEPINIIVEDQIPVSQNSQVEVALLEASGAKHTAHDGKLKWELQVPAQETKKVTYKFEVKYPKDQVISGLN